jgi:hypothetical protein
MGPRKQETTPERLAREQLVARVRATRKQGDTLDRLVLKGIWGGWGHGGNPTEARNQAEL